MKSLIDFIKESLNGKSKIRDSKYFRFKLTEIEDSTSKIIAAAEKDGLFVEKTDNGCKVKIYKTSKVNNLVNKLTAIIDDSKQKEDLSSFVEYLSGILKEIIDFTTPEEDVSDDEAKDDKTKDDDKKKEEE